MRALARIIDVLAYIAGYEFSRGRDERAGLCVGLSERSLRDIEKAGKRCNLPLRLETWAGRPRDKIHRHGQGDSKDKAVSGVDREALVRRCRLVPSSFGRRGYRGALLRDLKGCGLACPRLVAVAPARGGQAPALRDPVGGESAAGRGHRAALRALVRAA